MLNEQQVKNLIRKKAQETGITVEQLYRLYAIEQLVKKLSTEAELSGRFILKGGFLLTTILQLENRATADLDWTVANMKLDEAALEKLKSVILSPDEAGVLHFEWVSEQETCVNFLYNGYALRLNYVNGKMKIPVFIDLTTGEDLLPVKKQAVKLLFEEGSVKFLTYPLEQILADKVVTTLVYGKQDDTNSRAKDLYDIYMIQKTFPNNVDFRKVDLALKKTNAQRDLGLEREEYPAIIDYLSKSAKQQEFWKKFQRQNSYAREISFEEIFDAVKDVGQELILQG